MKTPPNIITKPQLTASNISPLMVVTPIGINCFSEGHSDKTWRKS